jgi:hypothetical protein
MRMYTILSVGVLTLLTLGCMNYATVQTADMSNFTVVSCEKAEGKNYTIRGIMTVRNKMGQNITHPDYCTIPKDVKGTMNYMGIDTCSGPNCFLIEYDCGCVWGKNLECKADYELHPCPQGCTNGSCP